MLLTRWTGGDYVAYAGSYRAQTYGQHRLLLDDLATTDRRAARRATPRARAARATPTRRRDDARAARRGADGRMEGGAVDPMGMLLAMIERVGDSPHAVVAPACPWTSQDGEGRASSEERRMLRQVAAAGRAELRAAMAVDVARGCMWCSRRLACTLLTAWPCQSTLPPLWHGLP